MFMCVGGTVVRVQLAGATREHYLGVYVLEGYGYTTSACKQAMEETGGTPRMVYENFAMFCD